MPPRPNASAGIPTQIKNPKLIERRRRQIVDAAVPLFIENGFHKTTTRQIAKAAGFSIGSLYEYVETKEDVLYMVCDTIHAEIEQAVAEGLTRATDGGDVLAETIRAYFLVCHRMNDPILLIYQETQSLPEQWRKPVLEHEVRITGLFIDVLARLMAGGTIRAMDTDAIEMLAHTITVLGHMWTFRRWYLSRHYSIDDYIRIQTEFIMNVCGPSDHPARASHMEALTTERQMDRETP